MASDKVSDAGIYADVVDEKNGNAGDRADMYRMGKAQEMRVCCQISCRGLEFGILTCGL